MCTMLKKKIKPLTAAQLSVLPISVGEAAKLLGVDKNGMGDDDVARKVLLLSELAGVLIRTLDLQ